MGFLSDNFIADFFKTALGFIQSYVGSYGWSIVLLTVLFRLLLLPLDIKQKKNMHKQKTLQPKIDAINKKYKNDKEMQSKKTMELYKTEGFSPLSGCLPMLIQMPIFFAFFGALRAIAGDQILAMYEAAKTMAPGNVPVESWLWVKNLWQPDVFALMANFPKNTSVIPLFETVERAYTAIKDLNITDFDTVLAPVRALYAGQMNGWFILPLAAGGMSFLQSKLTMPKQQQPQNTDNPNPMNGKMMTYFFPLFSVFICVTSSAAFALYWTASNIVSVGTSIVIEKALRVKEEHEKEQQHA